jgi:hypothetical protein
MDFFAATDLLRTLITHVCVRLETRTEIFAFSEKSPRFLILYLISYIRPTDRFAASSKMLALLYVILMPPTLCEYSAATSMSWTWAAAAAARKSISAAVHKVLFSILL